MTSCHLLLLKLSTLFLLLLLLLQTLFLLISLIKKHQSQCLFLFRAILKKVNKRFKQLTRLVMLLPQTTPKITAQPTLTTWLFGSLNSEQLALRDSNSKWLAFRKHMLWNILGKFLENCLAPKGDRVNHWTLKRNPENHRNSENPRNPIYQLEIPGHRTFSELIY